MLLLDQKNRFQMVELKYCRSNSVRLSPHQVSFASSHANALVWLLIKKDPISAPAEYYLYRGDAVMDVAMDGLKHHPHAKTDSIEDIIQLLAAT